VFSRRAPCFIRLPKQVGGRVALQARGEGDPTEWNVFFDGGGGLQHSG